jgi:hypothetical protein
MITVMHRPGRGANSVAADTEVEHAEAAQGPAENTSEGVRASDYEAARYNFDGKLTRYSLGESAQTGGRVGFFRRDDAVPVEKRKGNRLKPGNWFLDRWKDTRDTNREHGWFIGATEAPGSGRPSGETRPNNAVWRSRSRAKESTAHRIPDMPIRCSGDDSP